ncbi:MAG TPA: c-type cytochrome [Aggregatilineaceae bacterium]|nr:c-type cytochrome [Aggregatilineaceae bacterium]
MMKRLGSVLFGVLIILAALWLVPLVAAQGGEGNEEGASAIEGAALYAEFCQMCHGPQGEAVASGPAFSVEIQYNPDTTRDQIASGGDSRKDDGVAMAPYAQAHGGILSENQIDDVMAYIETWETGNTPELPEPNLHAGVSEVPNYFGDPEAGAVVYAKNCNGCHGREGNGRVPPYFPPFEFKEDVIALLRTGTDSPYMPAFAESSGGPLDDQELQDLETYMASWPPDEEKQDKAPEGVSTLVIIMGIASILFVGGAYWARPHSQSA